ncbi:MAG TPA: response regulator transcription factor [Chloroflexota bacterium]|nr:response regulator transcription factor [Chloroflexota bacterium]
MARILVVDDEMTLLQTISYNLRREGHDVITASDGQEAVDSAGRSRPDLIVLDLMLPKIDGFEVCRLIRRDSQVPILMLTARADEVDKVVGLEIGADDYMTKPFSMRELLARVKAMLRRAQAIPVATPSGPVVIQSGNLEIDPGRRRASRDGQPLAMKPREFDLLLFLIQNRGMVFGRDQLLDRVWGYDHIVDTRTVDVHVRWLREKIENDPSSPTRIETVRGVGYRFVS